MIGVAAMFASLPAEHLFQSDRMRHWTRYMRLTEQEAVARARVGYRIFGAAIALFGAGLVVAAFL
jgi:hypothetical protein